MKKVHPRYCYRSERSLLVFVANKYQLVANRLARAELGQGLHARSLGTAQFRDSVLLTSTKPTLSMTQCAPGG